MKKALKVRNARVAPILQNILICVVTHLILLAMLYIGVTPEQYNIQVGMPAPTQIKATKDIQDTVTTEALREQAAEEVEPSYKSVDPTILDEVLANLNDQFDQLRSLRETYTTETASALTNTDMESISETIGQTLTQDQLIILLETDDSTLEAIFEDALECVREVLESTLPEGQESNAIKSIRSDLSQSYSTQLTNIIVESVRLCLQPNMLIDEEITEANREAAREAVQTVWYVKDQVIVGEGEIVTEAQYAMIAALGILDENTFDVTLFVGLAVLILLVMVSTGFYLYMYDRPMLRNPKQIMLLCLIVVLVVGLCLAFRIVDTYLMPISLGLMLVALLIDGRLALYINLMISLLVSTLASVGTGMFSFIIMSSISAPMIVTLFSKKTVRTTTLLAGVINGAVNFIFILAVGFVNSAEIADVLVNAGVAAGSGIACAILCIGIAPLLEWMFNLATSSKLIELSNPNQPLLRRLLLEASGTYHHSIIVANLAEAACSAIGANGLLARVGAYYHDVGKLKRPMYFTENQMGDNPHDRTDPRVSAAILTAHPRDGAQMALKERIPEPVVDIIRQHHGDTPVIYFYDKALKLYGEDQVDISAFRYEGPRPQTREAAVVMLADTIEAATRALPNPDSEKIDALIRKLVRDKLNDGQLDNSQLTFNDLDKICSAFSTVLTGVFHERIEYPDVTIPPRTNKPEDHKESAGNGNVQPAKTPEPAAQNPAPKPNPAPQTNPAPHVNSAPQTNPAPQANPVPQTNPAPQPDAKPAVQSAQAAASAPAKSPIAPGRPSAPVSEDVDAKEEDDGAR